ncbi:hypothetical protein FACS1894162_1700 [Bacteroidia bacterium]|nr:hypothetical protein FACS1894162_1700 [Bacteroidia bacterium]
MKIFVHLFLFLSCSVSLFAQTGTVTGTLFDKSNNEAIISGSVELLKAGDSGYVAGAISDLNGSFSLKNVAAGRYILKVTYLGYLPITQTVRITANQPTVNVGKLYLATNDVLLKEAVVEGKKPEVIVSNDTIEYDAGSYKVTENAVLEDLLKKLPGVEVGTDGTITANGKTIKRIMVDGKEFFSDDPQIASKNLPAEIIDKLQVMDRKSDMSRMTGFDDGEDETVINLRFLPGMKKGTLGNALLGAGADVQKDDDLRYQGAAFVNTMKDNNRYTLLLGRNNNNNMGAADLGAANFGDMRMRRGSGGIAESTMIMLGINNELSPTLNLNGDFRYNSSDRLSTTHVTQVTLSDNKSQLNQSFARNNYFSEGLSANLKLEWKPNEQNELIFQPNFRYNNSHSDELEQDTLFNYDDFNKISHITASTQNQGTGYSFGGGLNYSHRFAKQGRVFSINARGNFNDSYSTENSDWTRYLYANGTTRPTNQRTENDNNTHNIRATVSWVEPIGNNNFLQATYRIASANTKSVNSIYDLDGKSFNSIYDWNGASDLASKATLNDSLSRSTLRNSLSQRIGLSFKAVRKQYNYTVGLNVDPSHSVNETYQPQFDPPYSIAYNESRLPNILYKDTLISSILQNVRNFSPVAHFNYIFDKRTNLKIDYEGETRQPSANQLRDYIDKTHPTNWVAGNPNLKPGYDNTLSARFQKYVTETQLNYNIGFEGGFSLNDITAITTLSDTTRLTTYKNVNGNWRTQVRGMFNMPLRNKKFTVSAFGFANYQNTNSYVDDKENTMRNLFLRGNTSINYRSDLFDIGLNVSMGYGNITYSVRQEKNQLTKDYGVGGNTTWYLPYHWTIESDIRFTAREGYKITGYDGDLDFNRPETIWNAAATKQLFDKKFGTGSLKLQIYDILQDRKSVFASSTTNGYNVTQSTSLPSYFMCSFIYKFKAFPGGSTATEDDLKPQFGGGNRGGRGSFGGSRGGRSF